MPTNKANVGTLGRPSEGVSGAMSPMAKMAMATAAKPNAKRPPWRTPCSTLESMMLVMVPANYM